MTNARVACWLSLGGSFASALDRRGFASFWIGFSSRKLCEIICRVNFRCCNLPCSYCCLVVSIFLMEFSYNFDTFDYWVLKLPLRRIQNWSSMCHEGVLSLSSYCYYTYHVHLKSREDESQKCSSFYSSALDYSKQICYCSEWQGLNYYAPLYYYIT